MNISIDTRYRYEIFFIENINIFPEIIAKAHQIEMLLRLIENYIILRFSVCKPRW